MENWGRGGGGRSGNKVNTFCLDPHACQLFLNVQNYWKPRWVWGHACKFNILLLDQKYFPYSVIYSNYSFGVFVCDWLACRQVMEGLWQLWRNAVTIKRLQSHGNTISSLQTPQYLILQLKQTFVMGWNGQFTILFSKWLLQWCECKHVFNVVLI